MAARDPLFVTGPGGAGVTSPTEARLALAGLVAAGEGGTGARQGVLQTVASRLVNGTTGMAYTVASFQGVAQRSVSGGVYIGAQDGLATVTTTAAPGSGSRYDLIWILWRDIEQGDPNSVPEIGVTRGAAAGSPARPYGAVPDGALVLAEALVPAGITATTGATITQVYPFTVARGAPIPVRNQAERDALTPFVGLVCRRLDLGLDFVYTADGWRTHGALTLRGQTEMLRFASGTQTGVTTSSGNIVVNTGLASIVTCIATPASAGTWGNATMQRLGAPDGGNVVYRWKDGAGQPLGGVSVAVDYIAIGRD